MENAIIEAHYPITFRKSDAKTLGQHIRNNHSVALVGMKRVGISNFLRYFIYHPDISNIYIGDGKKHLFFPIDLNDLVEREIFPFWTLTFKRIVDIVDITKISPKVKKEIEALFLASIQSRDLFLLIDSVRKALVKIVEQGFLPVVFFIRFDRIKDAVNPAFFDNLQGLRDATNRQVSFVITSFRSLDALSPKVFSKAALASFARNMYMPPLQKDDIEIIFQTYKKYHGLTLSRENEKDLFSLVDGYAQYLYLALIALHEKKGFSGDKEALFQLLIKDERIILQSEELWESLTEEEKEVLQAIIAGKPVTTEEEKKGKYLFDTGFVDQKTKKIFSPLFAAYVKQQEKKLQIDTPGVEFSKKEHLLYSFLVEHYNAICEREDVIAAVWPEVESFGVSDWAVDRLVARVRNKLKLQKSHYEIQTIKTRGYKLITIS